MTGRVRKLAHRRSIHRKAHVYEGVRGKGVGYGIRDDEERVHRRTHERDANTRRAFRLARPVRRVVPRSLEDLADIDGVTRLYMANAAGGALVPMVCGGVRWLGTRDAITQFVVNCDMCTAQICSTYDGSLSFVPGLCAP